MAIRQRKGKENSSPPSGTSQTSQTSSKKKSGKNKTHQFAIIFGSVVFAVVASYVWSYMKTIRAYTPLNAPKAVELIRDHNDDLHRLWGTYRSHLYFGVRARAPDSLLFGLLWFAQYPQDGQLKVRYSCEQGDNLPKYGWLQHDGSTYGAQEIVDEDFILTTEYIKRPNHGSKGGDWTARVKGKSRNGDKKSIQAVSLMFAVSNEGAGKLTRIVNGERMAEIRGRSPLLGEFKLKFRNPAGSVKLNSYLTTHTDDIYNPKDTIMKKLHYKTKPKSRDQTPLIGLPGDVPNPNGKPNNLFVHQVTLQLPFQIDAVFESEDGDNDRKESLAGDVFAREVKQKRKDFNEHFENTFQLSEKGFTDEQISFAKAAFSNCIGGITYLHGKSKVTSRRLKEPVDYWETGLYTGVPSRSFFPRGFLWDEGFHQIMIQKWDAGITRQILSHWLDLLNQDGWIPREQILGIEARRKVPDEFVVQHNENANPPTFFITIETLIRTEKAEHGHVTPETLKFLKSVFYRLDQWYQWYNKTQTGPLPGAYRWHGRDATTDREYNPKTLTSGLDDYPRASHPSDDERHVDLRCWIALASGILADIADIVGIKSTKYRETESYLKDNRLLDQMHWSDKLKTYADYGNHTKLVKLEWVPVRYEPHAPKRLARVVKSKKGPSPKFVDEFGYVSMFPFLLKILKPDSSKLRILLDDIRSPEKLWTQYGLRSLSRTAPSYNKHNTEHDKPYWRGPIWININFLTCKALHYYAHIEGPHQGHAKMIYEELRHNLVNNVYKQYQKTGYIWEQYDDKTGKGQGCYPFTGWSALINLIMAEKY
eukprot:TCONS_00011010-protein